MRAVMYTLNYCVRDLAMCGHSAVDKNLRLVVTLPRLSVTFGNVSTHRFGHILMCFLTG